MTRTCCIVNDNIVILQDETLLIVNSTSFSASPTHLILIGLFCIAVMLKSWPNVWNRSLCYRMFCFFSFQLSFLLIISNLLNLNGFLGQTNFALQF